MRIVAAGARADMGQLDAALLTLKCPELTQRSDSDWAVRLRYAYADLCEQAGLLQEAVDWFAKAADIDEDDLSDAAERLQALLQS